MLGHSDTETFISQRWSLACSTCRVSGPPSDPEIVPLPVLGSLRHAGRQDKLTCVCVGLHELTYSREHETDALANS